MAPELAIAFFDVEGYTEFTAEHGDEAGLALADSLLDIAEELVAGARGTVVKRLGDGLMARFDTAAAAVRCALGTQLALEARAALEDGAPVAAARIAIHAGTAIERDGDLFGNDVNIAARLADQARGGQILVTDAVLEGLGDNGPPLDAKRIGRLRSKGILERPAYFRIRARADRLAHALPGRQGEEIVATVLFDLPGEDMDAFVSEIRGFEAALNGVGARLVFTGVDVEDDDAPVMLVIVVFPDEDAVVAFGETPVGRRRALSPHGEVGGVALVERFAGLYRPLSEFGVLFPSGAGDLAPAGGPTRND